MEFCSAETASGRIQGLISSGVRQFKGVPYGASTAGANRFQRPKPATPWTGVRDSFGYAAVSPQVPYDVGHDYARLIQFDLNVALGGMGEDCLHLNIWTPGLGRQDKRAVLFCIHGGGFAICSGNHPIYDGTKLAQCGDVVVVTVTHRLSSFGYLNLKDLDPSGPWADASAAGMLDLVAALIWVRDNIENFGGDPGCVTIFGQSGGGWKVSTLLAMPAARGLFHRAAIQSGSLVSHMPREAAAQVSRAFMGHLGLTPATLDRIQELPWTQILEAQTAIGAQAFAPIVEGAHIPAQPSDPQVASLSEHVPLIISTTLDDAGLFFDRFAMTEQELTDTLAPRRPCCTLHTASTFRPSRLSFCTRRSLPMPVSGASRMRRPRQRRRVSVPRFTPIYGNGLAPRTMESSAPRMPWMSRRRCTTSAMPFWAAAQPRHVACATPWRRRFLPSPRPAIRTTRRFPGGRASMQRNDRRWFSTAIPG
jgi:para-nitrobenzyl esterase